VVPWGAAEKLTLDLPEGWKVIGVLEPQPLPPVPDVDAAVKGALAAPTGAPPLRTLAGAAKSVVLLVDDLSRPTPAHLLMPHVVRELEAGGVPRDRMTIVTTLGTHRDMTKEDVAKKAGAAWAGAIRWENHAYTDPEKNVLVGTTTRGTPVYINKTAASADLIVSLGVIEPHVIAGFGGGYKNLIPGAAGAQTIGATHTLNLTPATYNMAGRPPDENPMRLDLEEGGAMLKKPFFIVNTVLNSKLEIVHVAAGHPIKAHREGVKVSAQMCGVKIPREADVLITDSYPMDLDLRQGLKALANGIRAVRKGGLLIDLVRAEEGVGHMGMGKKKPPFGRGMLKLLAPLLLWALPRKRSAAQGEEDKFFTYFALQALRRNDLILYAPTIPHEFAANVPFVEFAWTIDEMWRHARKKFPGKADVLVFPAGGVTYPVI
jgi:nickel-dependent lactate racemase